MELFYVVSQDDAILHEGSEQECRAFLRDSVTREIAEAGALELTIISAENYIQRQGVRLPSREEMREFWQHQRQLDAWAQSLTDEQRKHLCNMGFFNSSVKGYAIRAAQEFGMTEDQTRDFLQCMSYALDMLNADEAEKLYCDF